MGSCASDEKMLYVGEATGETERYYCVNDCIEYGIDSEENTCKYNCTADEYVEIRKKQNFVCDTKCQGTYTYHEKNHICMS